MLKSYYLLILINEKMCLIVVKWLKNVFLCICCVRKQIKRKMLLNTFRF